MRTLLLLILFALGLRISAYSQLSVSSTPNYLCNYLDCNPTDSGIVINEICIAPATNNASFSNNNIVSLTQQRGEWVELYNKNICEPVDIGCYTIGNYTLGGSAYTIPAGTIIPAGGFCVIRGRNAPQVPAANLVANGGNTVELVIWHTINTNGVCSNYIKFWLPDEGGWFALYNSEGVAQDAVSYGSLLTTNLGGAPCVPTLAGCNPGASLPSYNEIPQSKKTHVQNNLPNPLAFTGIRRSIDGGNWEYTTSNTMGTCNGPCQNFQEICNGTATITINNGVNYAIQWNDPNAQTSATATNLCPGPYQVTLTDQTGSTQIFQVVVPAHSPSININLPDTICMSDAEFPISYAPIPSINQLGSIAGNGVSVTGVFSPAAAGGGTHVITYQYEDENGCSAIQSDFIYVIPTVNTNIPLVAHQCIQDSLIGLTAPVPNEQWEINHTPVTLPFDLNQIGPGEHLVTYSIVDQNNCSIHDSITIDVKEGPQVTFVLDSEYCPNTIYDNILISPTGGVFSNNLIQNYQLNLMDVMPGYHEITYGATNETGCTTRVTQSFTLSPYYNPDFDVVRECTNKALIIAHTIDPQLNYAWYNDTTLISTDVKLEPEITSAYNNIVTLRITDTVNNCTFSHTEQVIIAPPSINDYVELPNVITPNGDGINDYFEYDPSIFPCVSLDIHITNRWGQIVYTMDTKNSKFHGLDLSGNELPDGVYYYIVEVLNPYSRHKERLEQVNGFLHIIR